jgi:hypothetical protein
MARIYSTAFIEAVLDDTTPTVEYEVPTGLVAILRSADFYTTGIILPQNIHMYSPSSSTIWWVSTVTEPPLAQHVQWRGRQVFEEGLGFGVAAEEGTWGVRLSGYLLQP